eukprot:TRINITY_DN12256_c0_g1_i1.p1 TRINITY_DN12256_c0_g1~~TRINITY_DN12256_c0_g1_i1.p1  ORF type:complete len:164 (+),score=48.45 TRINITY_DN12256_c0_g1_i1:84-575(+)
MLNIDNFMFVFFLMIRRPPRSTLSSSSAASDVYKRQPVLSQFYTKHNTNKNFEIVFCSWDQTADQFQQYFSKQPWLALRWESGLGEKLGRAYGINSIPTLLVMDGNTKEIISRSGRNAVVQDPEALQFPWKGVDFPMLPMNTKLIMGCGALILGLVFLVFKPF